MFAECSLQNGRIYRPMTYEDLEEVLGIEEASFPSPWTKNMFIQELSTPFARNLTLWTPCEKRVLAGYLIFWMVAGEVHLQKIAVTEAFRRLGGASCLLKALLQSARKEQCRIIILEVRRSNIAARNLYEKFGFKITGIRRSYYSEEGEDALLMALELSDQEESSGH